MVGSQIEMRPGCCARRMTCMAQDAEARPLRPAVIVCSLILLAVLAIDGLVAADPSNSLSGRLLAFPSSGTLVFFLLVLPLTELAKRAAQRKAEALEGVSAALRALQEQCGRSPQNLAAVARARLAADDALERAFVAGAAQEELSDDAMATIEEYVHIADVKAAAERAKAKKKEKWARISFAIGAVSLVLTIVAMAGLG